MKASFLKIIFTTIFCSHYAGDVVYSIKGFIEKNRDTLYQDFKRLLYHSKNPVLSAMWPEGAQSITATTKRPLTAGTLFQKSMADLVITLLKKGKVLDWFWLEGLFSKFLKQNI